MKGRQLAGILGIFLSVSILAAGCAETPESSIVKQKGKSSMENYKEAGDGSAETAEEAAAGDSGSAGTAEEAAAGSDGSAEMADGAADGSTRSVGTADGDMDGSAGTDGGTVQGTAGLREAVGAPERYQSETEDNTGKLKLITDAEVEIPQADKASAIAVTQRAFDQDLIDLVTEAFFGDAPIYDYFGYTQMTKADWQAKIEELKGYAAEGNLDPYNYGTDQDGNYTYDLYGSIEAAEINYENAPEERVLKEVTPQFGLEVDYGEGNIEINEDSFWGLVKEEDGSSYSYRLSQYASMPMEIAITKLPDEDSAFSALRWIEYQGMKAYNSEAPDEETLKEDIGITLEEALSIADEKMEKLDLENMEMVSWEYALQYGETDGMSLDSGYKRERQTNAGYVLHYGRKLGGIPVTYTTDFGGALEDMDSEMETWCYERVDLYVTKEGIDSAELINLYDIGETRTEQLELMSFQEIMEVYEKMMLIQNADVINYESSRTYRINQITLGYSRIYEPATDSQSGLLVPVWDFFGEFESVWEENGEEYENNNATQYQSYLTINAVDGSVIDRSLGY